MLLLFALVFSQRGLIDLFNLKKENKKLDEAIRLEEQKLNENKKRISVFEKNQSMKERFIREQLGYIHEDEWLIEMQ